MEQDEQGGFAAEYITKSQAISAWNRRTATIPDLMQDPRVVALVSVMRRILGDTYWRTNDNTLYPAAIAALSAITKETPYERWSTARADRCHAMIALNEHERAWLQLLADKGPQSIGLLFASYPQAQSCLGRELTDWDGNPRHPESITDVGRNALAGIDAPQGLPLNMGDEG